jgi:hypothetical protein
MKLPWILFFSGLCANVYGNNTQQVLESSVDLFGTPYTCENGMSTLTVLFICTSLLHEIGVKPSITCTDPSSDAPNCSCTCTNGIIFDQPLLPAFGGGPNIALKVCEADKDKLLAREQEVTAELTALKSRDYQYKGCYNGNVLPPGHFRVVDRGLTIARCLAMCYPSLHFAATSTDCYCMDTLINPTGLVVSDAECSMKCAGSTTEKCGATGRTTVYSKTL